MKEPLRASDAPSPTPMAFTRNATDDAFLQRMIDARASVLAVVQSARTPVRFKTLHDALGLSMSVLQTVLRQMAFERVIIRLPQAHGSDWFRLPLPGEELPPGPPVRRIAIPTFDAAAFDQFVTDIFAAGTTVSERELLTACRSKFPHATEDRVGNEITRRLNSGVIVPVPLGSLVRYRRAAVPA